jgi:hypothetical protein
MSKILSMMILLLGFLILSGCSSAPGRAEPTVPSFSLIPTPQERPSTTPITPQRLRITNQSGLTIHDLRVRFPDETVEFGDVLPGLTTDYQVVSRGVYSYAAFNLVIDTQKYEQPVIDWVGESPMNGKAFTYLLDVDPLRWKTEGQVIRLVDVKKDP